MLSREQIEEWKSALAKASSPGWGFGVDSDGNLDEDDEIFFDAAREALPALLAERKELIGLLRDLEWSQKTTKLKNGGTIYTATTCPCCGGEKPDHAPGCRLAAFLR